MSDIKTIDLKEVIAACVWAEAYDEEQKDLSLDDDFPLADFYSHSHGPGTPLPGVGQRFKFKNGPEGLFEVESASCDHSLTERFDDEMVNYDDTNYDCETVKRVKG